MNVRGHTSTEHRGMSPNLSRVFLRKIRSCPEFLHSVGYMKIKAKLQIGAVLSIGITVVISIILFLASRQVDNAVKQSNSVQNIVAKVFESYLLLNDFFLRHEKQTESQWRP